MAIFSRRTLQRLLRENDSFVAKKISQRQADRLNEGDLSAEWELVLLNALNKLGSVGHEKTFGGKTPDIHFISRSGEEFLADIRTVSDKELHDLNPLNIIEDRLWEIRRTKKLPGFLSIQIGKHLDIVRLNKKRKLPLPELKDIDRYIFSDDFKLFLREIQTEPNQARRITIRKPYRLTDGSISRIDLEISYSTVGTSHSSHISYTVFESLRKNPIWRSLEDKYKDLRKTGYQGPLGIFLCDGDCEEIRRPFSAWYGQSLQKIISAFMRSHPKLHFVAVVTIKESNGFNAKNQIWIRTYSNHNCSEFLISLIQGIPNECPIPLHSAYSAKNFIDGSSFYGGGIMAGTQLKVSSRTVLDLLTGKLTYEDFPEFYKTEFLRLANEGRLFSAASVERVSDEDDDWLIFEFGPKDAAVGPITSLRDST